MKITIEIPDEYKVFCKDKLRGFFYRIEDDIANNGRLDSFLDQLLCSELRLAFLAGEYEE